MNIIRINQFLLSKTILEFYFSQSSSSSSNKSLLESSIYWLNFSLNFFYLKKVLYLHEYQRINPHWLPLWLSNMSFSSRLSGTLTELRKSALELKKFPPLHLNCLILELFENWLIFVIIFCFFYLFLESTLFLLNFQK